jgi:alpha-L-rhamnosidase
VLEEFARYTEPSGLVGPMPGWPFVDWKPGLDGWAERGTGIRSCIITMQYVGALHEAADLERAAGDGTRAARYIAFAKKSSDGVNAECWDERRGLYADTPEKVRFSQHANVLAVLHDIAPASQHQALLDRITVRGRGIDPPEGITGTSYYFSFYLVRAMAHAGLTDRYVDLLQSWRDLLQRNFTTWPETPDPSRSDTHAWSAHPTSGLLEYVAGIKSAAPGFTRVAIEPHLGTLTSLDAAVAHPRGLIETRYSFRNGKLSVSIVLPKGLDGQFEWRGQRRALSPGRNRFGLIEPDR